MNPLVKISDEDIASGRHAMAECAEYFPGCKNPVRYHRTVVNYDGSIHTEFFCEAHKPKDEQMQAVRDDQGRRLAEYERVYKWLNDQPCMSTDFVSLPIESLAELLRGKLE